MQRGLRPHRLTVIILLLILVGGIAHLLCVDTLLLEGAAGKQTHTAMIARNLHRGRATLLRPTVDDLGRPGYFVKEIPLLPAAAALAYSALGRVDERAGRLLSVAGWLAGIPVLVALLRRALPLPAITVAATWWIAAPLAFAYARAFATDASMVTASLLALLALVRFREAPAAGRAVMAGVTFGFALLLKPHAVLWLAPATGMLLATGDPAVPRLARRALALAGAALVAGCAIAATWYLHAAAVHRQYPAAGATGLQGWFVASALLEPGLYVELLRQLVQMVFTPLGLLVATAGLCLRRHLGLVERALLAWAAGVVAQSLVFNTRLFDEAARGTEYYQLAMVPVAAMLIGRGADLLARRAGPRAAAALAGILILLVVGTVFETRAALAIPERYARILDDCAVVQKKTSPHEDLFVLADRGGTILYYCDRRGTTFVPARSVARVFSHADNVAGTEVLAEALDRATYVYVPFPELLGDDSRWLALFEQSFDRIDTPGHDMRLYRHRSGRR